MVDQVKSWVRENSTLVIFLVTQFVGIAVAGASLITYYVRMETRVAILEQRGAPYTIDRLDRIDTKLTVLEQVSSKNSASIERIVDVMTRELKK